VRQVEDALVVWYNACTVVIQALTDAEGIVQHLRDRARQFVVQEAFDTTSCFAGS